MSNWPLILKLMAILFLFGCIQNIYQAASKELAKKCRGFSAKVIGLLVGGGLLLIIMLWLFALWIAWVAS